ncbi:MAG: cation:proton antiporter [Myxococcales bacterium]|nr:cation:proton antiporter [Myxococcales bacterium]
MGDSVLGELVVVIAVAVVSAALLRRLHVPPVVGFILAGVLIGPGGLALIEDRQQIELLAEVGVVLLLFTVGLKLRLADLWVLRRSVFGGGMLQVMLTGGVATAVAITLDRPPAEAVVWGAMVALSSTALVLWLLERSGDTGTAHGRTMISMLLFQDLAVIPIMLALPLLAGHAATPMEITLLLGRSVAVIVMTVVLAAVAFPWITALIVASGSRELFTLTTVLVAMGSALVFGHFGLSMALGAFLAGMVVSESEYVGRMIDHITPLRDVFNSLFFVSMGMLVEPQLWIERPLLPLAALGGVMILKALVAAAAAWPLLRSGPSVVAVGLGLAQIGEFSIVVATEAARLGLLPRPQHELLLAVAVPTLVLTPFIIGAGSRWARQRADAWLSAPAAGLDDHVIIVGYGLNGKNVARALRLLEVPHVVIDLNPQTVADVVEAGDLAVEGDASQKQVLRAAGIDRARGVVVTVSEAVDTRSVVDNARRLGPSTQIIARTRYLREVEPLRELGANEVIPEEFETSLELTARVLAAYGAPPHVVRREKEALRHENYDLLLSASGTAHPTLEALRDLSSLASLPVPAGSAVVGRTLRELDLRRCTGATVVAVERAGELQLNPSPDFRLESRDALVSFANGPALEALESVLERPAGTGADTNGDAPTVG